MYAKGWCELAQSISNQKKEEELNLKALGAYLEVGGEWKAWEMVWLGSWRLEEDEVKLGWRRRSSNDRFWWGGSEGDEFERDKQWNEKEGK